MFGSSTREKNVEDVVVEDAANLTIENPEDVFIEAGAVTGTIEVNNVGDIHVQSEGESLADPYRDHVVDGGDDAEIEGCENVLVTAGSVNGDLVIRDTLDDVFLQATGNVELRDVEDIFVNNRAISDGDSVRVVESEDVWVHDGAVAADVTAEDPEDILQKTAGAVAHGVEVGDDAEPAELHLVDTGDVLVETGGIEGELIAETPGDVIEDASF